MKSRNKDRLIESLKSENNDPNLRNRKLNNSVNPSDVLQQRKVEKELEAKVKELEGVIRDERKHMNRLQQLNSQLIHKIKEVKGTDKIIRDDSSNSNQLVKNLK